MTLDLGVLAERTVFTASGRAFDWGDVVEAADLRGEHEKLERTTREGLACARRAEAEGSAPTADALRAAATVFRYERDLLAAEELEAWLGERGLAVSDWNSHLRRLLLRERWAGELEEVEARYPVPDEEVEATLPAEAVCTGFLRRAAERLAEDVALVAGEAAARGDLAALTDAAEAARARAPSPAEVAREIEAHALDWIRIEAETLELGDAETAREAALCVRVDGRSLADVAEDCGVAAQPLVLYLGDAAPELRVALVSAGAGELIGPVERGSGLTLLQIREKSEPAAGDPELERRAAAALTARTVERALRDQVVWHERP